MNLSLRPFLILVLIFTSLHCAHKAPVEVPAEASTETTSADTRKVATTPSLPGNEAYTELESFVSTLDLTTPGTELSISSGGTSVYAVVKRNGRPLGAVLPENAATRLSGEVLSFRLSQILGVAKIYQPGFYLRLEEKNLKAFKDIVPTTPYQGVHKEQNRKSILERIQKNPQGIHAIFKDWSYKPKDYDALVNVAANKINTSHVLKGSRTPFASFLKCEGPTPSKNVTVSMNKGTTTEYEAAKELSTVFVIDGLVQQWDRFSGGNLQTLQLGDKVHFAAYDNGGTWGGPSWTKKYTDIVSRFDQDVAQKVIELNAFLNEGAISFLDFRSETELIQALGISQISEAMPKFKASLKIMAEHMKKKEGCYF